MPFRQICFVLHPGALVSLNREFQVFREMSVLFAGRSGIFPFFAGFIKWDSPEILFCFSSRSWYGLCFIPLQPPPKPSLLARVLPRRTRAPEGIKGRLGIRRGADKTLATQVKNFNLGIWLVHACIRPRPDSRSGGNFNGGPGGENEENPFDEHAP